MDAAGWIRERLRPQLSTFAERVATQRHLRAVRDGVIAALPLVLIGSIFLLLAQPPSVALREWVEPFQDRLLLPYRMLGGLVAIYVSFAVARSLAKSYGIDELGAGLVAAAAFFTAQPIAALEGGGWGLAAGGLGAGGIFGAILISLGSVELHRWLVGRNWVLRLPQEVPDAIRASFQAVLPALASVGSVWLVVHVVGLDIVGGARLLAAPLVGASDSLPGVLTIVLMDSGLWLLGIHPVAALAALKPVWLSLLTENMAAAAQGAPLPHIATREFYLWFVWQGGSGGTLAVAWLLLRARSRQLRLVGKLGFVPAVFNINEPILFGLPIVLNPRLALPFLFAPLVTGTIAYGVFALGWVTPPHLEVLWTLPAPLGAFLATGGDLRAIVLQVFNLVVAAAIWWPFLRAEDRRLLSSPENEAAPTAEPRMAG